jgi:carboxyl-terminal processing protease
MLGVVASLVVSGCSTLLPPEPVIRSAAEQKAHNRLVLDRVWELVNAHFFDATFGGVDWQGVRDRHRSAVEAAQNDASLFDALNAMLGELHSSHTTVLAPMAVWRRETRLYLNTGVVLVGEAGHPRLVFEVLPGSPAMEAGIRTGWIETKEIQLVDPAEEPGIGGRVFGEFLDERDQPRRVEMTLREIKIGPRRIVRELPGRVIYLRFDNFSADARWWFETEMKAHCSAPAAIVDLRFNTGGQCDDLVHMIGGFFSREITLGSSVERLKGSREWKTGRGWDGVCFPGWLVVLTSKGTASGAEILAAAVQCHRRGIVVGSGLTTAGHALVSSEWRLPDGGRLQVAVENYLTPAGERIEGRGVHSDIVTPSMKAADLRAGIDTDIKTALNVLSQLTKAAKD